SGCRTVCQTRLPSAGRLLGRRPGFRRKESCATAVVQRKRILVLAGNGSRQGQGIRSRLRLRRQACGTTRQLGERSLRGCACNTEIDRQLFYQCERGAIARGTHALGAGVWFPLAQEFVAAATIMTESRTLQFESPRALQSLYANDIQLLKRLEDSLGVKVTTREGWMKLEGDRSRVDKAQQVFQQLEQARHGGVDIQKHEFNYTLNAVTEQRDETLGEIVSTKIVTSSRKPPVVARSGNQRAYVEAIQKHDGVFGIGPAGTGKTYLAVAMAVAALKKEQVARIILTRPAVEAGEALGFLPG